MINTNKRSEGFSLIELSIVLIIIGLLVAGVTGGAKLIKTAQLRNVISESRNYKMAVNAYYALKDTIPGDDDNNGKIQDSNDAWGDLYTEKIISATPGSNKYMASKIKNAKWYIGYIDTLVDNSTESDIVINANVATIAKSITTPDTVVGLRAATVYFSGPDSLSLDTKLDDAKPYSGSVMAIGTTMANGATTTTTCTEREASKSEPTVAATYSTNTGEVCALTIKVDL